MIVAFMRTGFETQIRDFNWPQVENGPIKAGGAPPAVIDLLKGRSWPLRNQIATPACTAYAAMACVELSEATNEQEIKRVSVGGAYYHMKQEAAEDVTQPVRADSPGYTRFKDAVGFLTKIGYYDADKWDDRLTEAPSAELRGKKIPVCYHSYPLAEKDLSFPPTSKRPAASIACAIHKELSEGRPVGAGFPAYARSGGHGMTNWTSAFENGIVPMPMPGDALDMEAGHAVCIIGFTKRGKKGFFVFRNSFGEAFACAPTTDFPQGYGLVPATLVDQCCWEVMFMREWREDDPQGEEPRQAALVQTG